MNNPSDSHPAMSAVSQDDPALDGNQALISRLQSENRAMKKGILWGLVGIGFGWVGACFGVWGVSKYINTERDLYQEQVDSRTVIVSIYPNSSGSEEPKRYQAYVWQGEYKAWETMPENGTVSPCLHPSLYWSGFNDGFAISESWIDIKIEPMRKMRDRGIDVNKIHALPSKTEFGWKIEEEYGAKIRVTPCYDHRDANLNNQQMEPKKKNNRAPLLEDTFPEEARFDRRTFPSFLR